MDNDYEYIIVKIEKMQTEASEVKSEVFLKEQEIENFKKKQKFAIVLSVVSLLIKFPNVFDKKYFLNFLFSCLNLIGVYYFYLKKTVLEFEVELLKKTTNFKVELLLNSIKMALQSNELTPEEDFEKKLEDGIFYTKVK